MSGEAVDPLARARSISGADDVRAVRTPRGKSHAGAPVVTGMHLVSYLSPGLPEGLFHHLGAVLSRALQVAVEVSFVTEALGPSPDLADPLRGAGLAFVSGPSYVELRRVDAARLVPVAPV